MPAYTAREHLYARLIPLDRERLRQGLPDHQARSTVQGLKTMQNWKEPEDLAAWAEGARGWSGELVTRYGPKHHAQAFAAFSELLETGEPEPHWVTLQTIVTRVEMAGLMQQKSDPERFDKALEIWREARPQGNLEEVLEAHGLGPAKSSGGVVETGGFVNVGGALLRRRTAR